MAVNDTYLTHCTAVLDALRSAQVPTIPPPGEYDVTMTLIPLRPAFQALRFPQATQRDLEAQLWRNKVYALLPVAGTPWRACCVSLVGLCLAWVITQGRHPACIRFAVWHATVVAALMQHGTYDPATNHEPAPGEELDALERREEIRDVLRATLPAIADAFYGQEHDHAD